MALAKTLTDIANLALSSLGENIIQNIEDENDPARILRANISEIIRQVQSIIHWPELMVTITPSATSEMYNASLYQYNLPTNFLEIVEVRSGSSTGDHIEDWFIEKGKLVTSVSSISIKYKRFSEDVSIFSGRLTETIYRKLAKETCLSLTDNLNLLQAATMNYETCKNESINKIQSRSINYNRRRSYFTYNQRRNTGYISKPIGYRFR
jgi:hypothetical protein